MVLENLVASLIKRYLGPYVKNLNHDQLEINLFKGVVDLEDVEIRSDCLDFLKLPLTVKAVSHVHIYISYINYIKLFNLFWLFIF